MTQTLTGLQRRQAWLGLIFVSPWLLGLIIFKLAPIISSLGIAFTNFYALEPGETRFIGLENFLRIPGDEGAGFSLFATLSMALILIPSQLGAALLFASLLSSKRLRGKGLLRSLFFMPTIIPAIATVYAAFGFLDPNSGWLNTLILEPLGLPPMPGFFSEAGYNFFIMLLGLWAIGPSFLIMLGAMHGVPTELYEAARVDGAGPIYRFFKITIPMISPAIFFSLIISLISIFGGAALMDQGTGFNDGVSAFDGYMGYMIFNEFEYGYAASLAWMFFILMLAVVLLLFRSARHWVHYADGEHSL